MRANFVLILIALFSLAEAAEIVVIYPRPDLEGRPHAYDYALDSTFIFGRVTPPTGRLEINGMGVPFDSTGAFLAFLPLNKAIGTTAWNLSLNNVGEVAKLTVAYDLRSQLPVGEPDTVNGSFPCIVEVSTPNAHTRTVRGGSYQTFPLPNTKFLATGYSNGFFDIRLTDNLFGVIERRFVTVSADIVLTPASIGDGECKIEKNASISRFALSREVAWTAEYRSEQRVLDVLLFDTQLKIDRVRFLDNDEFLSDIQWEQDHSGTRLRFQLSQGLNGYDVTIEKNKLIISFKRPFEKNPNSLRNKIIALDAGHGGSADGSIGPIGTKEKDVVLKWSAILQTELERLGAIVVQTRTNDVALDLYERIRIARETNADFLLSLHANALPDDVNPFTRRGTGAYFYNSHSRTAAEFIQRQIVSETGLTDDGIFDANLALARPTFLPAVLIEAAYMIHPQEERLMNDDKFLKKLSQAVASALQAYFRTEQ